MKKGGGSVVKEKRERRARGRTEEDSRVWHFWKGKRKERGTGFSFFCLEGERGGEGQEGRGETNLFEEKRDLKREFFFFMSFFLEVDMLLRGGRVEFGKGIYGRLGFVKEGREEGKE